MKMSQRIKILDFMKKYGSITPNEAKEAFGCMRLAARIGELRDMGYAIGTRMKTGKNRDGGKTSFAEYYLIEEDNHE